MKKMNLLMSVLGMLALARGAFGADLADVLWDKSHLDALRSFSAAEVDRLTQPDLDDESRIEAGIGAPGDDIQEFTWATLTGDQQEHLVVVGRPLGSGGNNCVAIYAKSPAGKVFQEGLACGRALSLKSPFPYIGDLIQDVDGDGKDELVVPTQFGSSAYGAAPAAIWPEVYRLQNGKYVEASRDFAKFYDTQVLPILETGISNARKAAAREAQDIPGGRLIDHGQKMRLHKLIMARDKILRVIGRDPKAGEQEAREWVTGPVPDPMSAISVFRDIGNHEEDVRAARAVLQRWSEEQKAAGLSK